jgi:hypothetical protein
MDLVTDTIFERSFHQSDSCYDCSHLQFIEDCNKYIRGYCKEGSENHLVAAFFTCQCTNVLRSLCRSGTLPLTDMTPYCASSHKLSVPGGVSRMEDVTWVPGISQIFLSAAKHE